jgi:hypothetical protein
MTLATLKPRDGARPVSAQEAQRVGTALVPITTMESRSPATRSHSRSSVDFLAQLIAAYGKAPQTRQRRRAERQEAIAAYQAVDEQVTLSGRTLSRPL